MSGSAELNLKNMPSRTRYWRSKSHPTGCDCGHCSGADCGSPDGGDTPPLGSRGNSFTPAAAEGDKKEEKNKVKQRDYRRELAADQVTAANIYRMKAWEAGDGETWLTRDEAVSKLPARGVTMCGTTQIVDQDTDLMRQPRGDGHHAYLTGLQMCGLRWVCPFCTLKRAMADRQDVNDGLAAARSRGLYPVMITLTTRHRASEAAEDVLAGIMKAEQRIKRLKVWTRLVDGAAGYARVLEWTHGKHGHHPHFHTIILLRAVSEADAIARAETIRGAYMRQLAAAGRDGESPAAWERSFHVQGAAAAEGYITKWGLAEELTGGQAKDGGKGSLTPWQLLRLARTAPAKGACTAQHERQRYAAIWWEIICATKNKAQLYMSEGWSELVEEWRAEQPDAEPKPEPELVRSMGKRQRKSKGSAAWLAARGRTLAIREAAEGSADLTAARAAVALALVGGATDAEIIRAMEADDDPGPLIE